MPSALVEHIRGHVTLPAHGYLDVAGCAKIATLAHAGQLDKQGRDYITFHVAVVVHVAQVFSPAVVEVGWLHDVVEDQDVDLTDLADMRVAPAVVAGVDAMSRRTHETYRDLITRSAAHDLGRLGKLADNATNLAAGELWGSPTALKLRNSRYLPAQQQLGAAAGYDQAYLDHLVARARAKFIDLGVTAA